MERAGERVERLAVRVTDRDAFLAFVRARSEDRRDALARAGRVALRRTKDAVVQQRGKVATWRAISRRQSRRCR